MPKSLAIGRDIGPQICKALGLNGNMIQKISFTIEADKLVTVTVEHLDAPIDGEAFSATLKHYHLIEA